jgi:hypothetical protein
VFIELNELSFGIQFIAGHDLNQTKPGVLTSISLSWAIESHIAWVFIASKNNPNYV